MGDISTWTKTDIVIACLASVVALGLSMLISYLVWGLSEYVGDK